MTNDLPNASKILTQKRARHHPKPPHLRRIPRLPARRQSKDALGSLKQRRDWREAGVQQAKRTVRRGYAYGLLSLKSDQHGWTPKSLKLHTAGIELNRKIAEICEQQLARKSLRQKVRGARHIDS